VEKVIGSTNDRVLNGKRDQDSASAPTPRPHSPCPYARDSWHLRVGRTVTLKMLDTAQSVGYNGLVDHSEGIIVCSS
jgi:hypothetical protein